jgi:hypothetical protein
MLRRITIGVLMLTLVAACGTVSGGGGGTAGPATSATTSAKPDPAQVLAAAVTRTAAVPVSLTLDDGEGSTITGAYDPATGIGTLKQGADLNLVVTADEIYLDTAPKANKILRMKISKFPATSPLLVFADPVAALTLLSGATKVTANSATELEGTIDVSKVAARTTGARRFVELVTTSAGDKAVQIRFIATVDAQGYLSDFRATLPKIDEGKDAVYQVGLSGFGTPVSIAKPSGRNVIDAPAEAYTAA